MARLRRKQVGEWVWDMAEEAHRALFKCMYTGEVTMVDALTARTEPDEYEIVSPIPQSMAISLTLVKCVLIRMAVRGHTLEDFYRYCEEQGSHKCSIEDSFKVYRDYLDREGEG